MDKVYSWLQAEETVSEGRPVTFMDNEEGSWRKNKERRDRYNPYKEPNPGILKNLSKTLRKILASEKVVKTFIKPPKMIKEAVKSGKLAHLIKGIKKEKAKQTDTQLKEWIAPTVKVEPTTEGKEEPILMIRVVNNSLKRKEPPKIMSIEEMIFPPIRNMAPSIDHILISVQVYGRHVGRVLLNGGAACGIIYEHCFKKLRKDIREMMRDVYTTLAGFSVNKSTLRSDSPNNMRLVRTTIVRSGMIPSTMHSVVLYQSEAGPRVIMSEYQDVRRCELVKRLKETPPEAPLQVSECFNLEEKIIINSRYPEANGDHQKITPHKGQTRVDQAAQRQCRRIRLAVLGHDENPSNTKNKRNKLCHWAQVERR
ncbi:hypothetical protein Tco_0855396 [Tanacetum coccineum]